MEKQYKPVPDVECLKYHGTPEKPDIKIFVSHRIDLDSETIDNPLYIPVRCGAIYDDRKDVSLLGDNTGDNISEKRMTFNELTVQYWAWKNIKADYYGLCHYRRYLSFSKNQHFLKNMFQVVEEKSITESSIMRYGLSEDAIRKVLTKGTIDIVLPELFDSSLIENDPTYTHYKRYEQTVGKKLAESSIDCLFNTLGRKYPTYLDVAKKYYSGSSAYFCNCFVMKKDLFMHYSEWLFDILFDMEKNIDFENLSLTQSRILGFISEDLFSIYFMKWQEKLHAKEQQLIWFSDTTKKVTLQPAFSSQVIPIILSSDNIYSIYMGVLIQSIIKHSTKQNNYDIIILHTDISKENQYLLKQLICGMENFSIRFTDISDQMSERHFEVWAHYKKYNVYRLVAPEILSNYDKAIYFDSDIIVREDVANLYNIDIGENLIAAVPDIRFHAWNNVDGNDIQAYAKSVLKLPNEHKYFNSGVLVYNLHAFRQEYSSDFLLDFCAQRRWNYIDQDVLNIVCAERTFYLPMKWNCLITADNYETEKKAPLSLYQEYQNAHINPSAVHYAGNFLPFRAPTVDMYWYFWEYARNTPFYEILLNRMIDIKLEYFTPAPPPPVQYYSKARRWADKIMPKGSRRREFAKKILPKGSRRWNFCKKLYYTIFKG